MKRQYRKPFVIGIVLVMVASACAAPTPLAPTPTPGPLDAIQAYQDTYTKKDIEGLLALFASEIHWFGSPNTISQKALSNIVEFAFAENTKWSFGDCQVEGEKVICQEAVVTSDCVPPDLIGQHYEPFTFEFTNGKITGAGGPWDPTEEHNAAIGDFDAQRRLWASTNLPEDYMKITDPNEFSQFFGTGDQQLGKLTATELGQASARICKGYAEAKK